MSESLNYGKQAAFATDNLSEALADWEKWWIKRTPTDQETEQFTAGFNGKEPNV